MALQPAGKGNQAKHKGQKRSFDASAAGNDAGSGATDNEKAGRLASYAKLSLNKPGGADKGGGTQQGNGMDGHKHKKQRGGEHAAGAVAAASGDGGAGQQTTGGGAGPALTKAQKKNMKRDQRRKAAKASGNAAGAV